MSRWYSRVSSAPEGDYTDLVEMLAWFEDELERSRVSLETDGRRLEDLMKRIPGYAEYYYGLLQELEAVREFLEIRRERIHLEARKRYMEHYHRTLQERTAEKYADGDPDVLDMRLLINEVTLVRNKYLGVTKRIEYLHFQLTNVRELRKAGIEDATL